MRFAKSPLDRKAHPISRAIGCPIKKPRDFFVPRLFECPVLLCQFQHGKKQFGRVVGGDFFKGIKGHARIAVGVV